MEKMETHVDASEQNLSVLDLKITDIVPNNINNVILTVASNKCILHLPKTMLGNDYKRWKNSNGGVFYKDLRNFCSNKPCGKYVLLENNNQKLIVRLIENQEIDAFKNLNLINGKIKDKPYMTLKQVRAGEALTKTDRYIEYIDDYDVLKIVMPDNISSTTEDSDGHFVRDSISLFD
jgi:hypothetical protein